MRNVTPRMSTTSLLRVCFANDWRSRLHATRGRKSRVRKAPRATYPASAEVKWLLGCAGVCVALALSSAALAHGGNATSVAWDVCTGESVGTRCEFTDHHGDLHRGSCRAFDGQRMCVRNKPIISASDQPAAHRAPQEIRLRTVGASVAAVAALIFLFRSFWVRQRRHQS